jgi:hypothetical protein
MRADQRLLSRRGTEIASNPHMPVRPSSHPNDSIPHTPNDGMAETTAGKWPPRDRDPYDPVCDTEDQPERAREPEQSEQKPT